MKFRAEKRQDERRTRTIFRIRPGRDFGGEPGSNQQQCGFRVTSFNIYETPNKKANEAKADFAHRILRAVMEDTPDVMG